MSRRSSIVLLIAVVAAFALAWRLGFYTGPGSFPVATSQQPAVASLPNSPEPSQGLQVHRPTGEASASPASNDATSKNTAGTTTPEVTNTARDDAAASSSGESQPPHFDVVRVEPDGSAVIAGRAAPNETVSVTNGTSTLGEVQANAGGEFALELVLPSGEHRLRLAQAGQEGSRALLSDEAALVNVPRKGRANELLVMMERPGMASEILVKPQPPEAAYAGLEPGQDVGDVPPIVQPGMMATSSNAAQELSTLRGSTAATQPLVNPGPSGSAALETRIPAPRASGDLAVEAVEIENGKLFIAGAASPQSTIRVYLNDAFVSEATGGAGDRFIASAMADVPIGNHVIRADEIGANGQVMSRVEVPFNRPNTSSMSAIASAPTAPGDVQASTGSRPLAGMGEGLASTITNDSQAPALSSPVAAGSTIAAAESGDVPAALNAPEITETDLGLRLSDASSEQTTPGSFQPGLTAAAMPSVFVQAPLEIVRSRVIIRRGDTLWRISRQTYGRGSRYTVIYLANGDQIRDPDRIYPGQVFRMPDGEEATAPRG